MNSESQLGPLSLAAAYRTQVVGVEKADVQLMYNTIGSVMQRERLSENVVEMTRARPPLCRI